MKKIKNLFILLVASMLLSNYVHAQYWFPKSTDTLILKNNSNTVSPVYLGVGVDIPHAVLHTKGTLRHEDLTVTNDSVVLVIQPDGDVHKSHIDSLLKGRIPSSANAWLLTGNTITPTDYIGTNNNEDFRIWTNGGQRARYTWDGNNYELGTTNAFLNSNLSYLGGNTNISENDIVVFVYGSANSTRDVHDGGIIGRADTIVNSQSVVALGRGCLINGSNEGGVFGEELRMYNSHGSFMAGGHSTINSLGSPMQLYNISLGERNSIDNSGWSSTYGNTCSISGGQRNFTFGNNLSIINASDETFAFGSDITNDLSFSMKYGFNGNRTMTLTEEGVEIQMAPGNPLYGPSHNLEVMAGSSLGTVPEIQFQDLPTTSNSYDMVLIDPITFELYRTPNCCGGSISSSCSTQFMVPRVGASGSPDLVCSQIFDNGASVGIGTTTPRTFTGAGVLISGPPAIGTLSQLDVAGLTFTNTLVVSSDARLKKDVKPIKGALETVSALNGVTYAWEHEKYQERNLDHLPQAGFLAQEVEKVYPRAVVKDQEGFYAMNYNAVIPLLNEAIKELNTKVENQTKENAVLKSKLAELESKLSKYDKKMIQLERMISNVCESGCDGLNKNTSKQTEVFGTDNDAIIYPNPTTGLLNIQYKGEINSNASVIIKTMRGKEVMSSKLLPNTSIDLGDCAKGTYLVVIKNNRRSSTEKITLK